MRDLFVGLLGRLNNHGGSRIFTTPNTVYVPPDYEIKTDVPSVAEFVTCSLDGRLWIFRRSRRYYVAVLKWDNETQRLVFVSTTILNGETVIKRGVDWILTNKSLIQSLSKEPYISCTNYPYGDTSHIDKIKQSYSFFPEFETWQKIQNEQSLNVSNSPSNEWRVIQESKITPLEIRHYADDDFRTFTDFFPQICYCNGKIFAKGRGHIGRAYLIPRNLNDKNITMSFYLYISPDYKRNYDIENKRFDDNDGWDKLILAPLNESSVCIFNPDNQDLNVCKKLQYVQILSSPPLHQIEQRDFSVNHGAIFFDGFTHSNLVLNDNGASFLYDNLSCECKTLRQWFAPSNNLDVLSIQLVISPCDNITLVTHSQQGFYREALLSKKLSLSVPTYSDKRLAIGETDHDNVKILHVNAIRDTTNYAAYADWDNIFRFPFRLSLINSFQHDLVTDNIQEQYRCSRIAIIRIETWGDYTFNQLISVGIDGSNPVYKELTVPNILLDIKNEVRRVNEENTTDIDIPLSEHERIESSITFKTFSNSKFLIFHPQNGTCTEEHFIYEQEPQYTIKSESKREYSLVGPYAFLGANLWHVMDYDKLYFASYSKFNECYGVPDGQYFSKIEYKEEYENRDYREDLIFDASDPEWKRFGYYDYDSYYVSTPYEIPFQLILSSVTQNIAHFTDKTGSSFYVDIQSMCPDCPYIEKSDECRNYYSINNAFEFRHTVRAGNILYTFKSEIFPDML